MKRIIIIASMAFTMLATIATAQDLHPNQVPSVVLNNFLKAYPKAHNLEWEKDGIYYKVEFETGIQGLDHDIWYDETGKVIRHKQEINKSDLPSKVLTRVNADFNGYRIHEIEKITEGSTSVYKLELKSLFNEWEVVYDSNGKLLSKKED